MTTATPTIRQSGAAQRLHTRSFPTAREARAAPSDARMKGIGDDGDSVLAVYLQDVGGFDLLTPEEEQRLAQRTRAGDQEARRHFIAANLRLVMSIARNYLHSGVELLDLIQEGNLGLIRAVDKYDPAVGRFSTYATWWIHQAVSRAVEEKSGGLRLPSYAHAELGKIRRYQKRYREAHGGREPHIEEIVQATGMEAERVQELVRAAHPVASLNTTQYGEDGDQSLEDILPDTQAEPVEDAATRATDESAMERAVRELLSVREYQVIRLRYGLFGKSSHTLGEVGHIWKLLRERVRQIEAGALAKLRQALSASSLFQASGHLESQ